MPSAPTEIAIRKHVILRRRLDEGCDYLVDIGRKGPIFSSDPLLARDTGYSWVYAGDAEFIKDRIQKESNVKNLEINLVLFKRNKGGNWEACRDG